jgi:hypothetical protein
MRRSIRQRPYAAVIMALSLFGASAVVTSRGQATNDAAPRSSDLYVDVMPEVSGPPKGRIAVPVKFGYKGATAPDGADVAMTVDQGFTWEAVASIGTRVDEKTVKLALDKVEQSGMTKARLRAPDSWDQAKPILKVEIKGRGGAQDLESGNNTGTSVAKEKVPGVDLFMYPPAERTDVSLGGTATYKFSYGNQGSRTVGGVISGELINNFSWAYIPQGCRAASLTSPMTCTLQQIPAEGVFELPIKAPAQGNGIIPAVKYTINAAEGVEDENPANNNGVRYANLTAGD